MIMETIGYAEKFYIYKVASLPLEVTLRHYYTHTHTQQGAPVDIPEVGIVVTASCSFRIVSIKFG
jgi:hypothetical protein